MLLVLVEAKRIRTRRPQRRSQDICLGGGHPPGRCHPVHFPSSVVAEIFRDLHGRTRFSGGGVVAEIFQMTAGEDTSKITLIPGHFCYIYGTPGGHPPFIF